MRSPGREGVFVGGVGDPVVGDDSSDGAGSEGASRKDQLLVNLPINSVTKTPISLDRYVHTLV